MSLTFTGDVSENELRKMFRAKTPEGSMIVVNVSRETITDVGEQWALEKACEKFSAGQLDSQGNVTVTADDFSGPTT